MNKLQKIDKTDKTGIAGDNYIDALAETLKQKDEANLKAALSFAQACIQQAYSKQKHTMQWLKLAQNQIEKSQFIITAEIIELENEAKMNDAVKNKHVGKVII